MKESVLISGRQIGYQFNKKTLGTRRRTCIVHNRLGAVPWIKFNRMVLEVRRSESGVYDWEAVKQLPQ